MKLGERTMEKLRSLSVTELHDVAKQIIALIREKQTAQESAAAQSFFVGEKVHFFRNRAPISGEISRINGKTISLHRCTDGREWRVSPSFLKHGTFSI